MYAIVNWLSLLKIKLSTVATAWWLSFWIVPQLLTEILLVGFVQGFAKRSLVGSSDEEQIEMVVNECFGFIHCYPLNPSPRY